MPRKFAEIAFAPSVIDAQTAQGSRAMNARMADREDDGRLGPVEREFIAARDGFYQATVSETGWPYVQFKGGPQGFLKILDDRTLGYADFRGNIQYISLGHLQDNGRVSIILMDYAHRRRLKIWATAKVVSLNDDPNLLGKLIMPDYRARIERAIILDVAAFDWNCPQHITQRFTEAEWNSFVTSSA